MSHPDDLLADYVDGTLDERARADVDTHLLGCARCRDEVRLAATAKAALVELERRHPERPLKTNVEYYSALVLDVAEIPPPLAPAMFACSRVAGWSAHVLEQKRTGRLFRPSARYVGPAPRSLQPA